MSAALLREAAEVARKGWEAEASGPFKEAARIHLAVADWLDHEAAEGELRARLDGRGPAWSFSSDAVRVARAYLVVTR